MTSKALLLVLALAGCEDVHDSKWTWDGIPDHEHAVCNHWDPLDLQTCIVDGNKYRCIADTRRLRVACALERPAAEHILRLGH